MQAKAGSVFSKRFLLVFYCSRKIMGMKEGVSFFPMKDTTTVLFLCCLPTSKHQLLRASDVNVITCFFATGLGFLLALVCIKDIQLDPMHNNIFRMQTFVELNLMIRTQILAFCSSSYSILHIAFLPRQDLNVRSTIAYLFTSYHIVIFYFLDDELILSFTLYPPPLES